MSTIVIKTEDNPFETFEVDLANEPKEIKEEFRSFISKLKTRPNVAERRIRKKLSPKLMRASAYIDSIANNPESKAALAEADAIRKNWIRKND